MRVLFKKNHRKLAWFLILICILTAGVIVANEGKAWFQNKSVFGHQNFVAADLEVFSAQKTVPAMQQAVAQSSYWSDVWLLAKLIYGEARGEPYTGQVAVGAVVLNRTHNPAFPKTIAGVIFQPGAFSALYDGQFYLNPDTTALRAAQDALSGWDPTGGALYYWNPATATSWWVWTRNILQGIGRHLFAR